MPDTAKKKMISFLRSTVEEQFYYALGKFFFTLTTVRLDIFIVWPCKWITLTIGWVKEFDDFFITSHTERVET